MTIKSDDITIKTNHHERDVIYWWDLTDKERSDLDYLNTETRQNDFSGFRYRGNVYDLGEFEVTNISGWHGHQTESYFSAVVVKYNEAYDGVIVGYAFW